MVADINPCGAVVDFIRRSYRTTVRPFRDSEETAEIVWYPALPDAPTLPFPTTFNTGDQNPVFIDKTSPGEVYGEPRPFVFEEEKAHAFGIHQCGSAEDFVDGVEYDPERIVPYNDDGLPVCCVGWERGPCGCGAAGAEVTPPEPDGGTCADAFERAYVPGGIAYDIPYAPGLGEIWVTWELPALGNYVFRMEGQGTRRLFRGGDCGSLIQVGNFSGPGIYTAFLFAISGRMWAVWEDPELAPLRIWIPFP